VGLVASGIAARAVLPPIGFLTPRHPPGASVLEWQHLRLGGILQKLPLSEGEFLQRSALHHKTGLRPENLKNIKNTLVGANLVFALFRLDKGLPLRATPTNVLKMNARGSPSPLRGEGRGGGLPPINAESRKPVNVIWFRWRNVLVVDLLIVENSPPSLILPPLGGRGC